MFWYLLLAFVICILIGNRDTIIRNLRIALWSLKIPGPLNIPPLGVGHRFICNREEIFNRIKSLLNESDDPIIKFWFGPKLIVLIREPEYLAKVLQSLKLVEKDPLMFVSKPFIGEGLITGSGPTWKAHKKLIVPTVSTQAVESYYTTFHREAEILVQKLLGKCNDKNGIVLEDYLHTCSIDIVAETVMGIKLQTQSSINKDFLEAVYMIYFIMIERIVKPWLYSDILFKFSNMARVQDKTLKTLRTFIADAIHEKNDEYQAKIVKKVIDSKTNGKSAVYNDEEDEKVNRTTLEQLIDAKYKKILMLSDEEMIDEMLTMFIASSDTIASISSFCLKMLALHPEYQMKVVEEFLEVTDKFNRPLDPSTCSELIFLDRCIKETIRLFPIAPFIVRKNKEDFKISSNTTIPGGVTIMMGFYGVHRDPKHWSNPEEFFPDHFLPENAANRHPYAYIPFSSGLRTCIGKLYAVIAIKIIIVRVLQKLTLTCGPNEPSVKDMPLTTDISIRARYGNHVILHPRS